MERYSAFHQIYKNLRGYYRKLRTEHYFNALTIIKNKWKRHSLKITHISPFTLGNAGDTLLPIILRDLFEIIFRIKKWYHIHVHTIIDDQCVKKINKRDILLIGGGGALSKRYKSK
jgi:hypothetical protein